MQATLLPLPNGTIDAESSDNWGQLAGQIGSGLAVVIGILVAAFRGFTGSWPGVKNGDNRPKADPPKIIEAHAIISTRDGDVALDVLNELIARLQADNGRLWNENSRLWERNGELDTRDANRERQMRELGVSMRNLEARVARLRSLLVQHNIDPGND
jgi:hypothetical protein